MKAFSLFFYNQCREREGTILELLSSGGRTKSKTRGQEGIKVIILIIIIRVVLCKKGAAAGRARGRHEPVTDALRSSTHPSTHPLFNSHGSQEQLPTAILRIYILSSTVDLNLVIKYIYIHTTILSILFQNISSLYQNCIDRIFNYSILDIFSCFSEFLI